MNPTLKKGGTIMNSTLKKGDIILFKAEDSWLSQAIAKLTNSDVTHAVILYSEDSIIEMIAPGIKINPVTITSGSNAYVMRLNPELDAEPILKAADKYRLSNARYDFPALVILAGVLLLQRTALQLHVLPICNKIILAAARELDLFIQKIILKHPEDAMVCSQFVYQAYYDCGGDYRLQVKSDTIDTTSNGITCPCCLAQLPFHDYDIADDLLEANSITSETTEELAEQLVKLLEQEHSENLAEKHYSLILPSVHLFHKKMKQLSELLHTDLSFESMFITPADLAYHTLNLKRIDTIQLDRIANKK